MTINSKKENETLILMIEGRIDTTTAPELEKEINEQTGDSKNLILDMNQVEYISSAGLRVLLATQKKMSSVGSLKLIGVSDEIKEVFEMTGFSDILDIE